jgi:hypothetical protein
MFGATSRIVDQQQMKSMAKRLMDLKLEDVLEEVCKLAKNYQMEISTRFANVGRFPSARAFAEVTTTYCGLSQRHHEALTFTVA